MSLHIVHIVLNTVWHDIWFVAPDLVLPLFHFQCPLSNESVFFTNKLSICKFKKHNPVVLVNQQRFKYGVIEKDGRDMKPL